MSILSAKHYHNERAAYAFIENCLWADGRICPHCGVADRSGELKGKSTRIGVYKCYACRKPFTVKVGTVFEGSHIKLHVWLQAITLITASKKGISSNQLHRLLGITLRSAWFLSHRIREAMKDGSLPPLGGPGGVVEADETYHGRKEKPVTARTSGKAFIKGGKAASKRAVVSLVERGGDARSFHVQRADKATVMAIVRDNVARGSQLHTDESRLYAGAQAHVAAHHTVRHSAREFARGNVHSNSAEGYFSIFKRGMVGTYQHCGERHLHRYLSEFDFRYSNREARGIDDQARAVKALRGVVGKRLTYRQLGVKHGAEEVRA